MNQMNDTEGYRTKLREIEDKIKSIAGPPDHTGSVKSLVKLEPDTLGTLDRLLNDRNHCLNCLFRGTDEEIARFKKLNDRLSNLTNLMYRKTAKMYRMLLRDSRDGAVFSFLLNLIVFLYIQVNPIKIENTKIIATSRIFLQNDSLSV